MANMTYTLNPLELKERLSALIEHKIMHSVFISGAAGIAKSAVVRQISEKYGLQLIDLRLSQLAPQDIRGIPVPSTKEGVNITKWYPPEFLPRTGVGILFLDEFNMAPPVMQGVAQQLVLDRRVGSYEVPEGWFVWAAGNRKIDRAAVSEMPMPLANRFLHYNVAAHLESWKIWAFGAEIDPTIIGYLSWRSEQLHQMPDPGVAQLAWPSPRSWEMASNLVKIGQRVDAAVGDAVAHEYESYTQLCSKLPDIDRIVDGKGANLQFPDDPSMKFAIITELQARAMKEWTKFQHAFDWLDAKAKDEKEWISMFVLDIIRTLGQNDKERSKEYLHNITKSPKARAFITDYIDMTTGKI